MASVLIRRGRDLETHYREGGHVMTGRGWGDVAVNQGASRMVTWSAAPRDFRRNMALPAPDLVLLTARTLRE